MDKRVKPKNTANGSFFHRLLAQPGSHNEVDFSLPLYIHKITLNIYQDSGRTQTTHQHTRGR